MFNNRYRNQFIASYIFNTKYPKDLNIESNNKQVEINNLKILNITLT